MSSTEMSMPVLPWAEPKYPPPAFPEPPAMEPREPRRLGPVALLRFRDSMHVDSVVYAASGAEFDVWLQQLYDAIDAGQIDPRPSWEIEEAERDERVAAIVINRLQAGPEVAARPLAQPKRQRISGSPSMPSREQGSLLLRAAQLHRELGTLHEAMAGAELNPAGRAKSKVRKPRAPTAQPTELDVARAKKIMRERGMIR